MKKENLKNRIKVGDEVIYFDGRNQLDVEKVESIISTDIGKVAVNQGVAISEATASGASLPFPANIAAIAAGIAAVVAAFSMIASFADGGIVSSGSKIGDQNMVRVNGGEMILNGSQQERLFNMLNGGNGGNVVQSTPVGKVTFEIKGQKLRGVLKNSYRKSSKIG